jgi:hypothetical protein
MNSGIYGLIDPRTGKVMYVGKAVDIERRYRQHCSGKVFDGNLAKAKWIDDLRHCGIRPRLTVLREVPRLEFDTMDEAEKETIRSMKADGLAELNLAVGGSSRSVKVALNGSQDDWIALGDMLKKVREDLFVAANLAGSLAGAKHCDAVLKASHDIDKARSNLENVLAKTFPEWRELTKVFYGGR